MSILQNREVCFNQDCLPITYHNCRHKRLVRPKSKLTRISTHKPQGHFSHRDKMHLADHTHKKIIKLSCRKLKSDPYLHFKLPKIRKIYLTIYMCVIFLQNCSFDLSQKKSQITYHNILNKILVRTNSKSLICQKFQSISYMANSLCKDNIY